jgi:hypothetical protein
MDLKNKIKKRDRKLKEQNPQNYSKTLDKNKVLSPNEKLKEMQAFINSLQSKKETPKTKGR